VVSDLVVTFPAVKSSLFITLLKVIYCGSALTEEDQKESEALLLLANEFKVAPLLEKLGHFFKHGVQVANACEFYDRLIKVDPTVAEQVGEFIRLRTLAVLETEGFLSLSPEALKNLLKTNLAIDEMQLWKRVIVWAQRQAILQKLDTSNKEHLKQILGEFLSLIRFPTMSIGQLAEVSGSGLVPPDHLVQIFTYVGGKKDGSKWTLPYSLVPRIRKNFD